MDMHALAQFFENSQRLLHTGGIVSDVKTDAFFNDDFQVVFPEVLIGFGIIINHIEGFAEFGKELQIFIRWNVGNTLVDIRGLGTVIHHALLGRHADGVPVFLDQRRSHTVDGSHQGIVQSRCFIKLANLIQFCLGLLLELIGSLHREGGQYHLFWLDVFRIVLVP